jgi:hypothetical protein
MPKIVTREQSITYLRTLAETGNASIAAERAGVSRSWAYARRKVNPLFAGYFDQMTALAAARLPARFNRDRAGGWTAEKEALFLERLLETCSVPYAAAEVGMSAVSAYLRRKRRAGFAAAWDEAERAGWPPADEPWIAAAECFFEGREPPPGNPVRVTSIDEVLSALAGRRFVPRKPRQ